MLGAEVDGTMSSPRVKGAVVVPVVIPKKKEPLTVKQIAFLENLAIDDSGQLGIFAGYCCMVLHMRLRWMDGQFCQQEPFLDLFEGKASSNVAFITTRMLEDRNTRKGSFQLHATFPASQARIGRQLGSSTGSYVACQHNLESRRCRPLLPMEDGRRCPSKPHRQLPGLESC